MSFVLFCMLLIFGSISNFVFVVKNSITKNQYKNTLNNSIKSFDYSSLPPEIWYNVFNFVTDKTTRKALAYVSSCLNIKCKMLKYRIKQDIKKLLHEKFGYVYSFNDLYYSLKRYYKKNSEKILKNDQFFYLLLS